MRSLLSQGNTVFPLVLLLVVIPSILGLSFQGSRGIWDPDEGCYVSIAKAMFRSGDYLIPRLYNEPFLDKPPLVYWGISLGFSALGVNEWGARLFHALVFLCTVWVTAGLGTLLWGRQHGLLAGLCYATMLLPFAAANIVTPDTPLTLFVALLYYCFIKSMQPKRSPALWQLASAFVIGLGILTKGPAMVIFTAPIVIYLLLQSHLIRVFVTWRSCVGAVIIAVVGFAWYFEVSHRLPGAADYFWDNQVRGRLVTATYNRNPSIFMGPVVYGGAILLGSCPWLVIVVVGWFRSRSRRWTRENFRRWLQDPALSLLSLWFILPLAILCLSSSKLVLYALPLFPAIALLAARELLSGLDRPSPAGLNRRGLVLICLWSLALLTIKFFAAHHSIDLDSRAVATAIQEHVTLPDYEVVVLDEKIHGLNFYLPQTVERVVSDNKSYPFFVMPETLQQKWADVKDSHVPVVFVARQRSSKSAMDALLTQQPAEFKTISLAFNRVLYIYRPA